MTTVIIRDDDTSFFTPPARLEQLYGRLWERGLPVCLAVIPAQRADVRVDHRPGKPYDPSIPPPYRGLGQEYPITDNRELCAYLNQRAREGLVEICLHGFSHRYMEFVSPDADWIARRLADGRRILQSAFPDAPLHTFIAPYDRISRTALEIVLEHGFDVCTNTENLAAFPALAHLGPYQGYQLPDGRRVFTCDEYVFTHREDPEVCLQTARRRLQTEPFLIVSNHYWIFYFDWADSSGPLRGKWDLFLDDLLAAPDRRVTTFRDWPAGESV